MENTRKAYIYSCNKCRKDCLVLSTTEWFGNGIYIVGAPVTRVVFGVHPEEQKLKPAPYLYQERFIFCPDCSNGLFETLVGIIGEATGKDPIGNYHPDYIFGLGHWITLIQYIPRQDGRHLNFQTDEKGFGGIRSRLPREYFKQFVA